MDIGYEFFRSNIHILKGKNAHFMLTLKKKIYLQEKLRNFQAASTYQKVYFFFLFCVFFDIDSESEVCFSRSTLVFEL